ncbi:hypothetical protein TNCT_631791 [Trichonephila clavata]|uniref:Uncharacterized protein n=1 Tax=Trichonephila clavata TaxID=2740835 RepID=A0A8X6LD67_TRICU|nr:hypothetical protein TNCT_631791 [Trichonephila clavata]
MCPAATRTYLKTLFSFLPRNKTPHLITLSQSDTLTVYLPAIWINKMKERRVATQRKRKGKFNKSSTCCGVQITSSVWGRTRGRKKGMSRDRVSEAFKGRK